MSAVEWPHTTTLATDVGGQSIVKEYRWRFVLDSTLTTTIVAQHRRLPAGAWCEVRSPDRLAQLRALSSVNPAGALPVERIT